MNMNETITNVTLTKACSIKADKDSTDSKVIILKVKFDGATLQSVFDKAIAGTVITWQNGVGRKQFDTFKPNQTVEISFVAPASKAQVDPITALFALAETQGVNIHESIDMEAFLKAEIAKRVSGYAK